MQKILAEYLIQQFGDQVQNCQLDEGANILACAQYSKIYVIIELHHVAILHIVHFTNRVDDNGNILYNTWLAKKKAGCEGQGRGSGNTTSWPQCRSTPGNRYSPV